MKFLKKNTKAFTLIEIIAVIVILGIILLLVSIPVTKYVQNSKMKTYQSHQKELEVAAKDYMIDCISNNEEGCTIPSNGASIVLPYEKLVELGYSKELEDPDSDGYCDKSFVIAENNDSNGVDLNYKSCLICSEYKTDETWCQEQNLTCELELVGQQKDGWYTSGVTVNLKYSSANVIETGMNNDFTNVEYNGLTSLVVSKNGITSIFGYVKDDNGHEARCSKEVKIDMTNPEGVIYMGYQVYPKEVTTITGNEITINNIGSYGTISGVLVEFSNNLTASATGNIMGDGSSIKTNGSFVSGRDKASFEINTGIYNTLTIDLGNSSIKDMVSKIRVLKKENETSVWTNKDVAIYVDASDTITGVNEYSYDNKVTYVSSNMKTFNSNTSGTLVLKDAYGNTSTGYNYVISKIDKVVPTLNLDYFVDETESGSLYISEIDYFANDTFGNVEKIEYLEKNNKTMPSVNDTGNAVTINSYKNYSSTTSNKYVFFRAIDEAGNKSDWQRSNRYIGNQVSVNDYNNINVGTIGDTYNLKVYKCNNSSCSTYSNTVSISNNKFSLSSYGNAFYKFVITSDNSSVNVNRRAYLHNFESSSNSERSTSASINGSEQIQFDKYISDSTCNYVNAYRYNNRMYISAQGSSSGVESSTYCERGEYNYVTGDCIYCEFGTYDDTIGLCVYCEHGSYDSEKGACVSNYGTGADNFACLADGYTGELRWVDMGSTFNVDCSGIGSKGYTCGESIAGNPCSVEGDTATVGCEGWCESSMSSDTLSYDVPVSYDTYQYTIGVFIK